MPAFRHSCTALALILIQTLALPAFAQQTSDRLTLLDLIQPDRIAARFLQLGISALRTQADVVYGTMNTSLAAGTVSLTDLRIWPTPSWPTPGHCEMSVDRLRLSSVPLTDLDNYRLQLDLTGGELLTGCLPPDIAGPLEAVAGSLVQMSRGSVEMTYHLPTSAAQLRVSLVLDELVALNSVIELDYVWFRQDPGGTDPEPVVYLGAARTSVDNLGLWQKLLPMVPPMMTDRDQAAQMIGQALAPPPGSPPSEARTALATSASQAWAQFLADPRRLIVETSFADGPLLVPFGQLQAGGPDAVLDFLQLSLTTQPAALRALLDAGLLSQAYDDPASLDPADQRLVGEALATGKGAPRDLAQAAVLLRPLALAGDGAAALSLATALEKSPGGRAEAYELALLAAEQGATGAAGVLDRLESSLPLDEVLRLQAALTAETEHPVTALEDLSLIREEASRRMTGKGRSRSYETALMWSLIGAALGDPGSESVLAEIDALMAQAEGPALALWQEQQARAREMALGAWLGFDLPATLGGGPVELD